MVDSSPPRNGYFRAGSSNGSFIMENEGAYLDELTNWDVVEMMIRHQIFLHFSIGGASSIHELKLIRSRSRGKIAWQHEGSSKIIVKYFSFNDLSIDQ